METKMKMRELMMPNSGELYLSPVIDPKFSGTTPSVIPATPTTPPQQVKHDFAPLFNSKSGGGAPAPATDTSQYTNPATGKPYTPDEFAAKLTGTGADIPRYVQEQFNNPNPSEIDAEVTATRLNNARNDIATGETDAYGVASQSGIAYSPAELRAIEKAYAGIYDPAIDSALARLSSAKSRSGGSGGGSDLFTNTQLITGAINAGIGIEEFEKLDQDVMAFMIRNPKSTQGAKEFINKTFLQDIAAVAEGKKNPDDIRELIESAEGLTQPVKDYYLAKLSEVESLEGEERQTFLQWVIEQLGKIGVE